MMKRDGSFSPLHPTKKPNSTLVSSTSEASENELSNVLAEIEKAKEVVLASSSYNCLITQMETNPALKSYIDRILGSHDRMPMVIYGIDSIRDDPASKYRFALVLLLKDHGIPCIEGIRICQPNLSPVERDAVTALGCTIVSIEEHCRRIRFESEMPALYFMASTRLELTGDLLEENWRTSRLQRLAVLGHGFRSIARLMTSSELKTKRGITELVEPILLTERLRYACAFSWFMQEISILDASTSFETLYSEADLHLDNFGWHFFKPCEEIDLNKWLPRLPGEIKRRDWIE